jgi:NACalpha-BTF3-like transcription factor|eukprot:804538_1
MTAENEEKQLDSVTDRVQEHETLDSSKAKSAMAALTSTSSAGVSDQKKLAKIKISKEDVEIIMNELEVSEDVASGALREVIFEGTIEEGKSPLGEALRRLLVA